MTKIKERKKEGKEKTSEDLCCYLLLPVLPSFKVVKKKQKKGKQDEGKLAKSK